MLVRAITAALLACGAACVDGETDLVVPEPVAEEDVAEPSVADPDSNLRSGPHCEVPPDATDVCALACDPDVVFEEYVPEGTCTIFECPLADGTVTRVGGCKV